MGCSLHPGCTACEAVGLLRDPPTTILQQAISESEYSGFREIVIVITPLPIFLEPSQVI
jgi:hypothetical protein